MIARVSSILLLMTGLFVAAISFLAPSAVIETSQARANASSGWSWPLYEGFKAVDTPDDVHIWAVGNYSLIKYSANGGVSWATQQAPVGASLNSVDFVDAVHGWSVGYEGIILHTNNGLTWITQTSGVTASLNDVSFFDSSFGWAVGSDSTILRTTDGGTSWHQASSVPDADVSLYKVVFANRTTGWTLDWGDRLWVTKDGGVVWSALNLPLQAGDRIGDFSLLDDQRGWVVTDKGDVFRTTDGGMNWFLLAALPEAYSYGSFQNIAFKNADEGWIVHYRWYSSYDSQNIVFHSTDGGEHWTETGTSPYNGKGFMPSVNGTLWSAGEERGFKGYDPLGHQILSSNDDGATWNHNCGLRGILNSSQAVELVENIGFVLTSNHILRTEDGGLSWNDIHEFNDGSYSRSDIVSLDGANAWIAGSQGHILYSGNGGVTWQGQTSNTTDDLYAISMANNAHGLAVGQNGRIVRTTDGGSSWTPVTSHTIEPLFAVAWVDATTAVAVGETGTIVRTDDAGISWTNVGGLTKLHLYGVDFAGNTQTGWVVGQSRTILRSTDGGQSWQTQPPPPIPEWAGLYSVSAVSATEAHAGGRGAIIDTYDAGASWGISYNNANEGIRDIDFFDSDHGLAETSGEAKVLRYGITTFAPPPSPTDWVPSYSIDHGPTIDGDLSDWPEVEGVFLDQLTANTQKRDLPSHYDLSTTVRSLWTASTLYFAVSVFDNRVVSDSANVWDDDQVELGIDGLNDYQDDGADDHQYTINADGRKTDRAAPTEGFQAAINTRIDGYDAEIAIPAEHLQAGVLIADKVMGFNLGMHDDDTGGPYDTHLIWKGDSTFGVQPGWAGLELLADQAPVVTPPATIPTPSGDTVTLQQGFLDYEGAEDTFINLWDPDINNGESDTLTARADGAIASLLYYNLSPLPAEITIKRATLSLFPKDRSNPQTLDANIYALLRDWQETQTTWNRASSGEMWQVPGADGVLDREGAISDYKAIDWLQRWASFDITALVQRWSGETFPNKGLMIKYDNGPSVGYDFIGREATDWQEIPYRPELIISYWEGAVEPTVTPTVTPTSTSTSTPTPTVTNTPDCADSYEPDNTGQQANLILLNGEIQQHNYHQPGDNDYVKFGAVASDKLTLYTDNLASGVDTTLTLYDSDGITQLAYNDIDPANPPASRITWTAPANGTYFLKAANFNPDTGGCAMTYDLVTERITATSTPTPVPLYLPMIVQ